VPEVELDLTEMCHQLRRRYEEGAPMPDHHGRGAGQAREIADSIKDCAGFETR